MTWTIFQICFWITVSIGGILIIRKLHYALISLEERGYIYYQKKPKGISGGVFSEIDKMTRPSVEHVQKAMDNEVESQQNDGE